MPGTRIKDLTALSGASSANNDDLLIFDADADETKRISRSQLATGLVGDLPYTPSGGISATTVPTAIAELDTDKQPLDAGLTSIAGLTTAANKMLYTTAADVYAVADLTAAGRAILDDADAAAQRVTLGVEIGVDVQGYDADTAKYDDVTANFTGTLQNGGSDVVVDTDIGTTVQSYDADTAKTDVAQTFTAQQSLTAGLVLETVSYADLGDINSAINTTNKVLGKVVCVTGLAIHRVYTAEGSAAGDRWFLADGTSALTPS